MSIQRAEQLKREWTDQFVIIRKGVPELRRFDGLVGQVKTVNMNCRLLVQFETPADISWYDIDPSFVNAVARETVVPDAAPAPAESTDSDAEANAVTASETTVAKTASSGGSPLDQIRRQVAGRAEVQTTKAAGSPLDQIRQQVAASTGDNTGAPPAPKPKGGSPIDEIRQQAAKVSASGSTNTASASPREESGNPLDQIRAQAASGTATTPVVEAASAAPLPEKTTATDRRPQTTATPSAPSTARPAAPAGTVGGITPFDQVREQAQRTEGPAAEPVLVPDSVFDQIRRQAAVDDDTPSSEKTVTRSDASPPATWRGKKLPQQDDLKIVEGVGPKIQELLHAAGITTWAELSAADPERLRQLLSDAGSRFRMHNPDSWPAQAKLASDGQWQQLEQFQDQLDGGRAPE